jgi:hypothetical protein
LWELSLGHSTGNDLSVSTQPSGQTSKVVCDFSVSSKVHPTMATRHRPDARHRSHGRSMIETKAPMSNSRGPDAVVKGIGNVLQEQQKNGALKLIYLPKAVKPAGDGRDIRLQHLRDKGRSWKDRLRRGLASLSIAEQYKDLA